MTGPIGTISGTVRDAAGKPVAGASVYITRAPGAVRDVAAVTGGNGRFVLTAAEPGVYEIACNAGARGSAGTTVKVRAEAGAMVELRLRTP